MSCTNCTESNQIPECVDTITIGTIANLNTAVYIYIRNLSTGYVHQQAATSSGAGLVILDSTLPDKSFYNENHLYELWITLQSAGINNKKTITIDAEVQDCLLLNFVKTDSTTITTHIITI